MTQYSVSEVSSLTGVTIKTLHYYQKINLLNPSFIGANKYRYYTDKEIDVLQEIMFYRTMEIPLSDIKELLRENAQKPKIDILQKQLLSAKERQHKMLVVINTLERTIEAERSENAMETKDKFEGFKSEESIYRTMQNMSIIFSKPLNIFFMIFSIVLAGFSFYNLSQGISIYGDSNAAYISTGLMGILGIVGFGVSFRNVFFVKTNDLLDIVNKKYKTKERHHD